MYPGVTIMYADRPMQIPAQTGGIPLEACDQSRWPRREYQYPIGVIDATAHGEYAGSATEASNFRVLAANPEIAPYLVEIRGSHGWRALAYDCGLGPVPMVPALEEALEGLAHGDALDEDDRSDLESSLVKEAWDDWGRREFLLAVSRIPAFESVSFEVDAITNDAIDRLWVDGGDVIGSGLYQIEEGCGVYFLIDEWVKLAVRDSGIIDRLSKWHRLALAYWDSP